MKIILVMGAGYGDEGKGLTVDWACAQELAAGKRVMVVRANGGTQAAHTVQTPEGERHVFHHHGSGGYLGVPTYLSEHFLVSPMGFRMEREEMPALASAPVYCADAAQVTLPVDMMLNQMMEERRGGAKHGSCGWGIGETVERGLDPTLRVTVGLLRRGLLGITEIYRITTQYLEQRLPKLGLQAEDVTPEWHARLHDGNIIEKWLGDAEYLTGHTMALNSMDLDLVADTLVFEGAQGLGLDEHGEHFPHVTRSRTGSTNPLEIIQSLADYADSERRKEHAAVEALEAIYVMRAYATRHGAGPLEHEGDPHGCTVEDPTNVPNQWQDSLRSAPLDIELTGRRIAADFAPVLRAYPQARLNVMMTCIDQAGDDYRYFSATGHPEEEPWRPELAQGRVAGAATQNLLVRGLTSEKVRFILSYGPTRSTVETEEAEFIMPEWLKQALARLPA